MIDMESRTACFTGHRELPTDDLPEISKRLEDNLVKLIEQGYRYFGAGGPWDLILWQRRLSSA